jgi:hypothetical protein
MQSTLPTTNPRTEVSDAILETVSADLPSGAVESIENASKLSIRNATLTGCMVDFDDYKQL